MYSNDTSGAGHLMPASTSRSLRNRLRPQPAGSLHYPRLSAGRAAVALIVAALCTPLWFVHRTLLSRLGEQLPTLEEAAMLAALLVCWLALRPAPGALQSRLHAEPRWPRRLDRLQVWFAGGLIISFLVGNLLLGLAEPSQGPRFLRQYLVSNLVAYQLGRLLRRSDATSARYLLYLALVVLGFALLINPNLIQPTVDIEGDVIGTLDLGIGIISVGGNTAALFLFMFALCSWAYLLFRRSLLARAAGASLAAVFVWKLWLLSTRAVILALPLCLAGVLILRMRNRRSGRLLTWRLGIIALPLSLLMVYALWQAFPVLLERTRDFQAQKLGTLLSGGQLLEGHSLVVRLDQYRAYLPAFLTTPTGLGIADKYPYAYIQPHGLLLQLFAKAGWIGGASYLLFVILATYHWYETGIHCKAVYAALMSAMVVVNVAFLALAWGYDFFHRFQYQAIYMVLCGLTTSIAARVQGYPHVRPAGEG